MLRVLVLAAALAGGSVAPSHALDADKARKAVGDAIEGFVLPGYFDLRVETTRLSEDIARLCAAPSAEALETARWQFSIAVDAWSRIEMVRFGPVTKNNRLERMLYWPDRRSIGLKQVQAILAERDPSAASAGTLVQKSVAVQGLGALEFVLHGTGAELLATAADAYRCAYGKAVAANLEHRATDIESEWKAPEGGFARVWSDPSAGNALYRTPEESLVEVINTLVHGLELIRDVRIDGFLGETAADDRPKLAIFWRSGKTVDSIRRNLDSLHTLFERSDLAALLPADRAWIAQSVAFEFANADRALMHLDGPVDAILADPDGRASLAYARLVTSSLSDLVGARLTAELGLTAGFSSLDGD
ncbi:MAG: imelysin family protein [Mesorhizobium sp.]|nr:imelysin family protein [Mesorhizobium sp.]